MTDPEPTVRVHLTNVAGAGATQLLVSLLPALERNHAARVSDLYLPDRGGLADYRPATKKVKVAVYKRLLFNPLSRLLECTALGHRFNGTSPLLVLGDLPLRCNAPQTVFVQTPHLAANSRSLRRLDAARFAIARWVFRRNARFVRAFIVQTAVMQGTLALRYPEISERIHVIGQPVPHWLLCSGLRRTRRIAQRDAKLSLVYPAATYPHKNHRLLADIATTTADSWPVDSLKLTIDRELSPAPQVRWIQCVGFLPPDDMIDIYGRCDALLFLSTDESYGFPLLEAMFVGLPIICPDLPYARTLCGAGAIYFDPSSTQSLGAAVRELHGRLKGGWWPDWSQQLSSVPQDWDAVAAAMLNVALQGGGSHPSTVTHHA